MTFDLEVTIIIRLSEIPNNAIVIPLCPGCVAVHASKSDIIEWSVFYVGDSQVLVETSLWPRKLAAAGKLLTGRIGNKKGKDSEVAEVFYETSYHVFFVLAGIEECDGGLFIYSQPQDLLTLLVLFYRLFHWKSILKLLH
jgi:hypothetical protein